MIQASFLCLLSLFSAHHTSQAIVHNRPSVLHEIYTGLAISATVGAGYLFGRGLCTKAIANARDFFQDQMSLVGNRFHFDESTFQQSLKRTIIATTNTYFNSWWRFGAYEEYKNYPLVFFRMHLKGYIDSIKLLKLFRVGLESYDEAQEVIAQLEQLLQIIDCDYDYIKERRRFEERETAHMALNQTAGQKPAQVNVNVTVQSR